MFSVLQDLETRRVWLKHQTRMGGSKQGAEKMGRLLSGLKTRIPGDYIMTTTIARLSSSQSLEDILSPSRLARSRSRSCPQPLSSSVPSASSPSSRALPQLRQQQQQQPAAPAPPPTAGAASSCSCVPTRGPRISSAGVLLSSLPPQTQARRRATGRLLGKRRRTWRP